MQIRLRSAVLLSALAALACMPFAACGTGGTITPGFVGLIIGPAGGHGAALNVQLDVPAGAFAAEHTVAIEPQGVPPPIEDPSVQYFHAIVCIGPLGLGLDVPGHVRCCYDLSGLPMGAKEQDLVLLEWNDVLQVMQVSLDAVQNLSTHCFDDFSYDFLGHIAIGVRTGPQFEFVFLGSPQPSDLVAPLLNMGGPTQVQLADLDGALPVLPMDDTFDAETYLPSRNGSRVLYTAFNADDDGTALSTVDVAGAGPLDFRVILHDGSYTGSPDSLFGWLGDQDRIYHEHTSFSLQALAEVAPRDAFAAAPGDTETPDVDLETQPSYWFIDDVRVSPDRSMVLVRWTERSKGDITHIDVLDAVTGAAIGTDLPAYAPTNSGDNTPRWFPDSSHIYYIEPDGVTVTMLDPDGGGAFPLYRLTRPNSGLLDFVLCPQFQPEPQRCAFILRDFNILSGGITGPIGPDFYATDTVAGDDYVETDLKGQFTVEEMVPLYSDNFKTPLVLVQMKNQVGFMGFATAPPLPSPPDGHTLVFAGGDSAGGADFVADIPAPIMNVDVARSAGFEGQILVWVQSVPVSPQSPTAYTVPGIYLLDANALNPTLVTPPGFNVQGPPRWLKSWRFSPGFDTSVPRVR